MLEGAAASRDAGLRRHHRIMDTTSSTPVTSSPVDDRTYDLLQALTSKLEAIEAYEMYTQDDDSGVFEELLADERRHADRLLSALRNALTR
jgi:hypothetical protein